MTGSCSAADCAGLGHCKWITFYLGILPGWLFLICVCLLQSDENEDQQKDGLEDCESLTMLQLSASLKLRDLVSQLDSLTERAFPYDC